MSRPSACISPVLIWRYMGIDLEHGLPNMPGRPARDIHALKCLLWTRAGRLFLGSLRLSNCFLLFSCGSTPKVEDEEIQTPEAIVVPEEPEEVIDDSDDVILIDEVVVDESEEEYLRSINNLQAEEVVTKSEFEEDKAAILAIIEDLAEIMEEEDFNAWMNYISKDSKTYYSNPKIQYLHFLPKYLSIYQESLMVLQKLLHILNILPKV